MSVKVEEHSANMQIQSYFYILAVNNHKFKLFWSIISIVPKKNIYVKNLTKWAKALYAKKLQNIDERNQRGSK